MIFYFIGCLVAFGAAYWNKLNNDPDFNFEDMSAEDAMLLALITLGSWVSICLMAVIVIVEICYNVSRKN